VFLRNVRRLLPDRITSCIRNVASDWSRHFSLGLKFLVRVVHLAVSIFLRIQARESVSAEIVAVACDIREFRYRRPNFRLKAFEGKISATVRSRDNKS
jgi:hypothetical protein